MGRGIRRSLIPVLRRPPVPALACCAALAVAFAVHAQERGEAAVAERYAAWAEQAIAEGRWNAAERALERASDYADVSSDLSYLLALARFHENRPQRDVLEALGRAFGAGRWNRYSPETARLLEARCLIRLRSYSEALERLAIAVENADTACLRLSALRFLPDLPRFREYMAQALARYPQEPRLLGVLFSYARSKLPQGADAGLIETALRRLPLLAEADRELIPKALPFIRDSEEARRLIASYWATGGNSPAAIPGALKFGVIDEETAMRELFAPYSSPAGAPFEPDLDRALIREVWALLRSAAGRETFSRNLAAFSGVIIEDSDDDGCAESRTRYQDGLIVSYDYDPDQDGVWDLHIVFSGGFPAWGEMAAAPASGGDRGAARIWWERYPAVLKVELEGLTYIPSPKDFSLTPVRFSSFNGEGPRALLYPEADKLLPRLTGRTLASFAHTVERPSGEFKGAVERLELSRGIPLRAAEWLGAQLVSRTEFAGGWPLVQRVDLDLDGRMETIRRFRQDRPAQTSGTGELADAPDYSWALESSESDWDGDGVYETGESYLPGGGIARSWDMNKDGVKEYTEIWTEE